LQQSDAQPRGGTAPEPHPALNRFDNFEEQVMHLDGLQHALSAMWSTVAVFL
jgi:hypothetical protein